MSENGIEGLPVSDPEDLERTAQEIALLTRSPEVAQLLKQRKHSTDSKKHLESKKKKGRPILRVIENADWNGGVSPDLIS